MSQAAFKKLVLEACRKELVSKGFASPRKDTIVYKFNDVFWGWIGLNTGVYQDHINVNPFLGLHCVPLMRMYLECSDKKYQSGSYATVAWHIGTVCPDEDVCNFYGKDDLERESKRLAQLIHDYGIPSMEEKTSYGSILPMLKEKVCSLGGAPQKYAIALHLSGRTEEAVNFLEEQLPVFEKHGDRVAEPFKSFRMNFLNSL